MSTCKNDCFSSKAILVVDDQPLLQKCAQKLLESFGMPISLVSNGAEALQQIQTRNYALILMDLGLPDLTGQEVAKAILSWQKKHLRPLSMIAALSAQLNNVERQQCYMAGMQKAYEKPLTPEKVEELLKFAGMK